MQCAGASVLQALERRRVERRRAGALRRPVPACGGGAGGCLGARGRTGRPGTCERAACPRRRGDGARGAVGRLRPRDRLPRSGGSRSPRWSETEACAQAWTAGESLLEHLAVLYAIEACQPEISKTKLEGLTEHYGYSDEGPALEYFRLHELLDVEHARAAGALIEELLGECDDPEAQADRMLARARAALRGTGSCSAGSKRPRRRARRSPRGRRARLAESRCAASRQANSTAATEVARLRLETPARIGMLIFASARAVSSSLRP